MAGNSSPFQNSRLSYISFSLSIVIFLFWALGQMTNVYRFALIGAIYELLWLPMLMMIFILPVFSFVFLVREKFNIKSLYLYTIIVTVTNILLLVFI
jgi:hypothetical protein